MDERRVRQRAATEGHERRKGDEVDDLDEPDELPDLWEGESLLPCTIREIGRQSPGRGSKHG
jgi:hypothetical protein